MMEKDLFICLKMKTTNATWFVMWIKWEIVLYEFNPWIQFHTFSQVAFKRRPKMARWRQQHIWPRHTHRRNRCIHCYRCHEPIRLCLAIAMDRANYFQMQHQFVHYVQLAWDPLMAGKWLFVVFQTHLPNYWALSVHPRKCFFLSVSIC